MVSVVCFIDKEGMTGTCSREETDCFKCTFPTEHGDKNFIYRIWDDLKKEKREHVREEERKQQNYKGERE